MLLSMTFVIACESRPKKPGEEVFDAASAKAKDVSTIHSGNTEGCKERSRVASEIMTDWRSQMFSANDGMQFRVHCHESEHGIAFLMYVPKLNKYVDVRGDLAELGWATVQMVTADLGEDGEPLQLGLGMRGEVFFGVVGAGAADSTPNFDLSKVAAEDPLLPFFAATESPSRPLPEGQAEEIVAMAETLIEE